MGFNSGLKGLNVGQFRAVDNYELQFGEVYDLWMRICRLLLKLSNKSLFLCCLQAELNSRGSCNVIQIGILVAGLIWSRMGTSGGLL
jgi:hypothetical protein